MIDDGGLFSVLNAHATTVVQGDGVPRELELTFRNFLTCVEAAWLQPPTKHHDSPLGRAYYEFWHILAKFGKRRTIGTASSLAWHLVGQRYYACKEGARLPPEYACMCKEVIWQACHNSRPRRECDHYPSPDDASLGMDTRGQPLSSVPISWFEAPEGGPKYRSWF